MPGLYFNPFTIFSLVIARPWNSDSRSFAVLPKSCMAVNCQAAGRRQGIAGCFSYSFLLNFTFECNLNKKRDSRIHGAILIEQVQVSKKRGPYSSPRQRDRRLRILRTAGRQLERHGLAAMTMQSIAEISEVSTKTLYNLFGSRDLLLLEAASELLDYLERSAIVMDSEEGIPRLLAFTEGAMSGFEQSPEYSKAIISLLVRAELDQTTLHARLGRVQRFTYSSLSIAAQQGELRPGLDLNELSYLIAGNQWGIALLWEKGLIQLQQLEAQTSLSHYLTLTPLCQGKRKKNMEVKLDELLSHSSLVTQESTQLSRAH